MLFNVAIWNDQFCFIVCLMIKSPWCESRLFEFSDRLLNSYTDENRNEPVSNSHDADYSTTQQVSRLHRPHRRNQTGFHSFCLGTWAVTISKGKALETGEVLKWRYCQSNILVLIPSHTEFLVRRSTGLEVRGHCERKIRFNSPQQNDKALASVTNIPRNPWLQTQIGKLLVFPL